MPEPEESIQHTHTEHRFFVRTESTERENMRVVGSYNDQSFRGVRQNHCSLNGVCQCDGFVESSEDIRSVVRMIDPPPILDEREWKYNILKI